MIITGKQSELTRKHVSDMFYNAELECEIRKCQDRHDWAFINREKYLQETNQKRYQHNPANGSTDRGK